MRHIFRSFIILALLSASQLQAAEPPRRLIELAPHSRVWLTEREILKLSHTQHERGRCGGFLDVTEHTDLVPLYMKPLYRLKQPEAPSHPSVVEPLMAELSSSKLIQKVDRLQNFHNRYYKSQHGVDAAHWIRDEFVRLAGNRADITVELVQHSFEQPSVIARIQGSSRSAEKVILGAHEDSVNWSSWFPSADDRAPGADDDASGVATVLETFRVLANSGYRPARTIEFITYAGEEHGLLGSQAIAKKYQKENVPVVGVLQLDMTLYAGKSQGITVIEDHVDPDLTRFMIQLIETYVKVPWAGSKCGYGCSDHASWTKAGYPSAFPFEAPMGDDNPKIHTANDTIENGLDADFGLHFAKLAVAFAVELGGVADRSIGQ